MTPAASSAPSPTAVPALAAAPALADFWSMDETEREDLLLRGIAAAHTYHFEHNTAYRNTVAPRGVGPWVPPDEMSRLLRTTSQAFKSYIDILGTSFPQDRPTEFIDWLAEQVSVDMRAGSRRLHSRYRSLEGLLKAVDHAYAGLGLKMLTSSGTSGRMTIIPRDRRSTDLAAESFSLSFQRYLGVTADFTAIFMTPKRTRVAVPHMARSGVRAVGLSPRKIQSAARLPAGPGQVRIRTGRTYRPGWRGAVERHIWHPLMATLQSRLVDAQAVESAVSRLIPAGAHGEKVLLFGSLPQLHKIASFLLDGGRTLTLAPGSLLATWGGVKEASTKSAAEMRQDLGNAFKLATGEAAPVRDTYGMAEANWAAMQCARGSYHLPPWLYAVTLDDQEALQKGPRSTGMLAFFDPYGGGDLFPAFFRTADRVTLVRGPLCPCGEPGDYLEEAAVQRLGLRSDTGRTTPL
jgi:hypothetical protein